jgi:AraC-like DNA-binding protein
MDYRGNLPPPFAVRTAGSVFRRSQHSSPGTRDNDCMLVAVLSGQGVYSAGNREIRLHGGLIGLITPDRPGVLMAHPAKPYHLRYCRFGGAYAHHMVQRILAREGAPFFAWPSVRELADLIKSMGRVKRVDLPETMAMPEVLLAKCLVSLCGGPVRSSDPEPLAAFAIHDWLCNHVDQPTDLDLMADAFGVSRSTLSRMVRRLTGSSVQVLHEKAKMDWAVHLLRHAGLSIKQVAHRVGYSDPLYFTRVFRKHRRASPSLWRRQHGRRRHSCAARAGRTLFRLRPGK